MMKNCSKCQVNPQYSVWHNLCRACEKANHDAYFERNKERIYDYKRAYREKNREKWNEYQRIKRENSPEYYRSLRRQLSIDKPEVVAACNAANRAYPDPQPCSVCGSTEKIQRHHPDYSKPLDIIWLCHVCHTALHNDLRKETRK